MKITKRINMKRWAMALAVVLLPLLAGSAAAQTEENNAAEQTAGSEPLLRIGYFSYQEALTQMADYALVQQQMADLRSQYEAEVKRVEQEFNQKYEDFLEGQRDFPKTILQKRQTELQELMEKNIAFRKESLEQLKKAEEEAMAPLKARLAEVLATVGKEGHYVVILNTDSNACPFIADELAEDVSQLILDALK